MHTMTEGTIISSIGFSELPFHTSICPFSFYCILSWTQCDYCGLRAHTFPRTSRAFLPIHLLCLSFYPFFSSFPLQILDSAWLQRRLIAGGHLTDASRSRVADRWVRTRKEKKRKEKKRKEKKRKEEKRRDETRRDETRKEKKRKEGKIKKRGEKKSRVKKRV